VTTDYQQNVQRALRYICDHLDNPLTLSEVASVAHLSQYHFHRIFRAAVGEPVGQFISRKRLESGALWLAYQPGRRRPRPSRRPKRSRWAHPLAARGPRQASRQDARAKRIGGETEPPDFATETNTGRAVVPAQNPQSPVRIRQGPLAKTPRNRGIFRVVPEDDREVSAVAD
jgi:AraC-like DNA-binding protein